MSRRPTNELPKSKKIEIDPLLKEKFKSSALRKEIRTRVNAHELLESMRLTVHNRTVQKIQQTQQNKGTEAAAGEFMDEVTSFDGWATAFLDALHYNRLDDLAKKLYQDYVPPTNDDDDDDDDRQGPRVSPPKYTETDKNLQKTSDAKTIIVKDQSEKMAELQRKRHSPSSDQPLVSPTPLSVTQTRAKHAVCPAASRPSSRQDSCAAMTNGAVIDKKLGSVAESYADDDNQLDYSFPTTDFSTTESLRPSSEYCDNDIGSSGPSQLVQFISNQNNDEQAAVPNISNPVDLENVVADESIRFGNESKEDSSNVCMSDTRQLNSDDDAPSIAEDRE